MMVFFLSNMIENQCMSTGAFEITLNGELRLRGCHIYTCESSGVGRMRDGVGRFMFQTRYVEITIHLDLQMLSVIINDENHGSPIKQFIQKSDILE